MIVVDIQGVTKARKNLTGLEINTRTLNDAYEKAGGAFRSQLAKQFAGRGMIMGVSKTWAPLTPRTIRNKRGNSVQLIHKTEMLKSYIIPKYRHNINKVTGAYGRFGSSYTTRNNAGRMKPVAVFHQIGYNTIGSDGIHYKMPARPVALGNKYLDREFVDIFVDHLFEGWIH